MSLSAASLVADGRLSIAMTNHILVDDTCRWESPGNIRAPPLRPFGRTTGKRAVLSARQTADQAQRVDAVVTGQPEHA